MKKLLLILFFYPALLMAQPNTVVVGTIANDGTGDPLRTAMQKLNANDVAIFDTAEQHLIRIENLEDVSISTVTNALSFGGGVLSLGGNLTGNTSISNNGLYNLQIATLSAGVRSSQLYQTSGYSLLAGYDNDSWSSTTWSAIRVLGSTVTMEVNGAINSRYISLSSSAMTVGDDIGAKGLVNAGDYSANATDRSLIDKAHVEALIAAAGYGGDSVQGSTLYNTRSDTIDKLSFAFTDSAQFVITRKYMLKKNVGDTIYFTKWSVQVPTGSPNFAYNIYHATDASGAGTKLFNTDPVVTGSDATSTGEIDTPNNPEVPPEHWIWIQFSDLTTKPPTGAAFTGEGYEQ